MTIIPFVSFNIDYVNVRGMREEFWASPGVKMIRNSS
jgi:hypothetical protein